MVSHALEIVRGHRRNLFVFELLGVPAGGEQYGVHSPGWLMDKQLKLGLDFFV